ncbi:MAG: type II secretion system ATPase GspE [Gammaproteobacteria bacterium]|jgi:general secretion pathway protein E
MTDAPLKLPFSFAKKFHVITQPGEEHDLLVYQQETPTEILLEVQRIINRPLQLQCVSAAEFDKLLESLYQTGESSSSTQLLEDLGELDLQNMAESINLTEDILESENDAPVIRLINALLREAVREHASDIHIEPFANRLIVRFRVDGVLRNVLEPPPALTPLLISRIKVMAKLDIAEKRLPQDGRIALQIGSRAVDVRVSTMPSNHGERVVLRLLDKKAGQLDVNHLGMSPECAKIVKEILAKPYGIILVTGPTGAGKSTTLYAMLSDLNDATCNILTVEDPIEYDLPGIGQTQVNPKVEMTFARGLRAILRQDPDIVMIGEIRDLETAEIAVQASLTGHLVLSTLHTNTAIGAAARLIDMGVAPFLLASSLVGLIAQRLVRLLCEKCKVLEDATEAERKILQPDSSEPLKVYHPKGCPACQNLGYVGRSGIYEVIPVDDEIRNMIHERKGEATMMAYAREHWASIRQDGLRRVRDGVTTIEEVLRATAED